MSSSPLDSSGLDRSIGDLAAALGDPTRRGIFLAVRQSAEAVTSTRIAELFSIHPNVARHHLDRLAEQGYLRVTNQRSSGRTGPGAGRPAKCYEATSKAISIHPGRRYDLLVELLVRVLDRVEPEGIANVAEQVGREYGMELATSLGTPNDPGYEEAVQALAKLMGGVGFDMSIEQGGHPQRLLTSHCPFGEAATGHPEVVCSLDRGMVAGIMGVLQHECRPVLTPHTDLADDCVTEVAVQIGKRAAIRA